MKNYLHKKYTVITAENSSAEGMLKNHLFFLN